jgi:hypothetical protein
MKTMHSGPYAKGKMPPPIPTYDCDECENKFVRKDNLRRHLVGVHKQVFEKAPTLKCNECGLDIPLKEYGSHTNTHVKPLHEGAVKTLLDSLPQAPKSQEPPSVKPNEPLSPKATVKPQKPFDLTDDPVRVTPAIMEELKYMYTEEIAEFIEKNWSKVRTQVTGQSDWLITRQIRLTCTRNELGRDSRRALRAIFEGEREQFKVDLAFTTVNRSKTGDELYLSYASNNSRLLESMDEGPALVDCPADLERVFDFIESDEIFDVSTHGYLLI